MGRFPARRSNAFSSGPSRLQLVQCISNAAGVLSLSPSNLRKQPSYERMRQRRDVDPNPPCRHRTFGRNSSYQSMSDRDSLPRECDHGPNRTRHGPVPAQFNESENFDRSVTAMRTLASLVLPAVLCAANPAFAQTEQTPFGDV